MRAYRFIASIIAWAVAVPAQPAQSGKGYQSSFYLLHEDHHTYGDWEVGRDADPAQTARLIALSRPDLIQIHAKGNPGWTTYPSKIGYTPPRLARDVLAVWRDIARRDGYLFSVYYNIGRDGEIMERRPEWNRIRHDSRPFERALCYHSGVAENYLWPMIDEIMERYRPDGFWFDGSCFTVTTCYCQKCTERFRREHGIDPPLTMKQPGWEAFQEMQREVYREFVRATAQQVKKRDPKCLVAFNFAYSLRMPEQPPPEIDYLTGDFANEVEALSAEAHWYDGQGRPFDLMTRVYLRTDDGKEPKPAEQIQQEMAIIIANGGRYFAWDSPSQTTGLEERVHKALAHDVAPFLRARQAWCLATERVPDVSLLYAASHHYADTARTRQCFARPRVVFEGAETLVRRHLNYEFVSAHRLRRGDIRTPLLIVENPKRLKAEEVGAIRKFAEDGGCVLMTGSGLEIDGMAELFGLELVDLSAQPKHLTARIDSQPIEIRHTLCRVLPKGADVLLSAGDDEGTSLPLLTLHRFGKGRAAFVAVPLMTPLPETTVPDEVAAAVFEALLPERERRIATDAPPTVEVVLRRRGETESVVHLVNRHPGKREKAGEQWGRPQYRITQIPAAPPCTVTLRLPARPTAVTLQPQRIDLDDWQYDNGRLVVRLPQFAIHQMLVVR